MLAILQTPRIRQHRACRDRDRSEDDNLFECYSYAFLRTCGDNDIRDGCERCHSHTPSLLAAKVESDS